jgi:hypothetical protein
LVTAGKRIEVMIALVLAATLAGVTLGSNLRQVLLEHPGAQRSAGSGQRWVWSRRTGGTVAVTADDVGKITRVDFVANRGEDYNIDLPCVAAFPVQDSDANLQFALGKTACGAFNGLTYGVPDRSMVEVRFDGPGDGRLIEAIWYRPSEENPSPVGHLKAVIDYLRPALTYVAGAARIYYAGECPAVEKDTSGQLQFLFPAVFLESPPAEVTGMNAVRQIFRDDPNATVMQDRSGMLRITIGSVSTAILQTRIQALTLDPIEQYSAESAVATIVNAPELHAAERSLNFHQPLWTIDIIVSGPIPGAPHLPKLMKDVTLDEALDSVARTFKGIVMYGVCKRPDGKYQFTLDYGHG